MKEINYRISLKLCDINSNILDLSNIFENVHEDMPSKSRKFGIIKFVCGRVIMKRFLYLTYLETTAKIIKALAYQCLKMVL